MTEKDVQMFKMLSASDTGIWLVDYLERMSTKVCDVRYEGGTAEERKGIANLVEKELIDKIRLQNVEKKKKPNEWE